MPVFAMLYFENTYIWKMPTSEIPILFALQSVFSIIDIEYLICFYFQALKLLQHAVVLDPLDPDILNAYGEFLMPTDIVMADHMFTQASIVCPTHIRALINLKRTAPVVDDIDGDIYNRLV